LVLRNGLFVTCLSVYTLKLIEVYIGTFVYSPCLSPTPHRDTSFTSTVKLLF